MTRDEEYEEMKRLMDKYEKTIKDCPLTEFRDLRFQLKQLMEKMRSRNNGSYHD